MISLNIQFLGNHGPAQVACVKKELQNSSTSLQNYLTLFTKTFLFHLLQLNDPYLRLYPERQVNKRPYQSRRDVTQEKINTTYI